MINKRLMKLIKEIPKAELHCHIDSIPPQLLLRFAERNNIELPFNDIEGAVEFYNFKDLDEFLEIWRITLSVVRTEEDYSEIAQEFMRSAAEQNIIYREGMFTFASAAHEDRGISLETVVKGLEAGRKVGMEKYGVDLRYNAEIDRTQSPERTLDFVKRINEYKDMLPISAIGLDCEEIGYPAAVHEEAFNLAGELGFKRTAHCGEDLGPESVWDSINNIHVDRIDHGARAIEDPELVEYLAERDILLTLCPISNIEVGVYPTLAEHSIKALMDRDVKVCINSDDPPFMKKNLIDNYIEVADAFDLNEEDIITLVRNAFLYNHCGNEHLETVDNWIAKWKNGEIE